jgi:hypothetical protein
MKTKIAKFALISLLLVAVTTNVSAQECPWLPDFLCTLVSNDDPTAVIEARVRAAMFIAVGIIILIAISYGLYNAYKYIKSGGGDGMSEASQGMQGILFGIGSIFVILLGIAAVLIFFGSGFMQVFLAPTCIAAPNGAGCYACQNQKVVTGGVKNADACGTCNANSKAPSVGVVPASGFKIVWDSNKDGQIDTTEAANSSVAFSGTCDTVIKQVK